MDAKTLALRKLSVVVKFKHILRQIELLKHEVAEFRHSGERVSIIHLHFKNVFWVTIKSFFLIIYLSNKLLFIKEKNILFFVIGFNKNESIFGFIF